jgi:hypothetical protein
MCGVYVAICLYVYFIGFGWLDLFAHEIHV